MKFKFLVVLLVPVIAQASYAPPNVLESRTYRTIGRAPLQSSIGEPIIERSPLILSFKEYYGNPDLSSGNIRVSPFSGNILINGSTKAPRGTTHPGIETPGTAFYEFTINNYNNSDIVCTIIKHNCMDDDSQCLIQETTYQILKKSRIRDYGSKIINNYRYPTNKKHAHTTSRLIFEGCGSYKDTRYDRGHYEISR